MLMLVSLPTSYKPLLVAESSRQSMFLAPFPYLAAAGYGTILC